MKTWRRRRFSRAFGRSGKNLVFRQQRASTPSAISAMALQHSLAKSALSANAAGDKSIASRRYLQRCFIMAKPERSGKGE